MQWRTLHRQQMIVGLQIRYISLYYCIYFFLIFQWRRKSLCCYYSIVILSLYDFVSSLLHDSEPKAFRLTDWLIQSIQVWRFTQEPHWLISLLLLESWVLTLCKSTQTLEQGLQDAPFTLSELCIPAETSVSMERWIKLIWTSHRIGSATLCPKQCKQDLINPFNPFKLRDKYLWVCFMTSWTLKRKNPECRRCPVKVVFVVYSRFCYSPRKSNNLFLKIELVVIEAFRFNRPTDHDT